MKFRMNMYLDNCYKPVEFEGRRPKVKVAWFFVRFCQHVTVTMIQALSKAWRRRSGFCFILNQSVDQSKHICIAPYVPSESEARFAYAGA